MSKVVIIGCGGVARVGIYKCAQNPEVFSEILIASRTLSKCDAIKDELKDISTSKIYTRQIDASDFNQLVSLFNEFKPDMVLHLGMPFHNLTIMDACLECNIHYLDTAGYEPVNVDDEVWRAHYLDRIERKGFDCYFDYEYQWEYKKKFEEKNLVALLGCGFDPGVTQAYVAYAKKHHFDRIDTIDILDCNGGDHGYKFATNFNPEINLREVSSNCAYIEDHKWKTTPPLAIKKVYDFDGVGMKDMYQLYHEEIESITKNLPEVSRIRFYMTFSQSYIDHMNCLKNVGMLSATPIMYEGREITPIQFLKALLPDPASLGPRTKGKTNIGCIFTGIKDGKEKKYYIYNICDHEEAYKEVGSQAISYTTGVPAMCGAMMVLNGKWNKPGVFTLEELDCDEFLDLLDKHGLPRKETFDFKMVE